MPTVPPGNEPSGDVEPPAPPWRKSRRNAGSRPPRRPLGRAQILDTALEVLRAEGLDAVSMRRVAQDLGTGPASLYAHVSGKDELLELMLERILAHVTVPEPDPDRWREQIKEVARDSRRILREYRDISLVSLANIPTGGNQLRIAEGMLAIILAGGVPPQIAAWTIDRLALYIDADCYEGAIFFARLQDQGDPHAAMAEYVDRIRGYFRRLPPDRFPIITSMVDTLMEGDDDTRFEFGLDLIVRGLDSYVTGDQSSELGEHPVR